MPRWSPRSDLLLEEIEGECLVLDLEQNVYFTLNALGRFVWRALEKGALIDQIITDLVSRYPTIEPDELARDVHRFLQQMNDHGLITHAS